MKKIILFSLIILFTFRGINAQQGIIIIPPLIVAGGSQYGSVKPRIALLHDTLPVVCWTSNKPTGNIFFSKWNGTGFSTPVKATPPGFDFAYANPSDGPTIAVKGDTVFITFFYYWNGISKIYLVRSVDGGTTFGDTVRVDHQTGTDFEPYSPFVTIAADGNPYVAFEMSTSTGSSPQQMFCKSGDDGNTFSNEISVNTPAPGKPCECCPPFLLIKDSVVYCFYRNNISNIRDIWCSVSDDSGASFDTVFRIDFTNYLINGCPSQGPEAIFSGDSIIAVWTGKPSGGNARIYAGVFHAGTFTVGDNIIVDPLLTGNAVQWNPVIAGRNDTIAVAWEDTRTLEKACYLAFSTSGFYGFGNAIQISDSGAAGPRLTPSLAYRNGVFHIVYQDDENNQVIYRKLILNNQTGVAQVHETVPDITLFPNPISGKASIRLSLPDNEKFELRILDPAGRIVYRQTDLTGRNIILARITLPPGIYSVVLAGDKGVVKTFKLVSLSQ